MTILDPEHERRQRDQVDSRVEEIVASGSRFLREIVGRVGLSERFVDRSLQRLRAAGRVRYLGRGDDPRRSGWVVVAERTGGGGDG